MNLNLGGGGFYESRGNHLRIYWKTGKNKENLRRCGWSQYILYAYWLLSSSTTTQLGVPKYSMTEMKLHHL
jgi:hypothetical protein